MDPPGWMSNLLWKRVVKSHVTWNGTGCLLTFSKTTLVSKIRLYRHGCLQDKTKASFYMFRQRTYRGSNPLSDLAYIPVVEWLATFNQKRKIEQGKGERSCPLFSAAADHIERSARHLMFQSETVVLPSPLPLFIHMRWRVWLGNIMEMYRTANPGMTVRPRPWPRGVASSTEL
ncbi:unnamed protein product [Dovyalis caffra]|uniref:Uncharacterized protein n=1 Tax=Dovyalis caffra TaxID=77055 RepID=A0AAV1R775_9ROSI|nr:unnamed protein product [Dovyalis caffra]CAK7328775.1 unnamed protein product [Dovyalis caffra]